MKRSIIYS